MSASFSRDSTQELFEQSDFDGTAFGTSRFCVTVLRRVVLLVLAGRALARLRRVGGSLPLEDGNMCTSTSADANPSGASVGTEPSFAPDVVAAPAASFGDFLPRAGLFRGNSVGTALGFSFLQPSARCCSKLSSRK